MSADKKRLQLVWLSFSGLLFSFFIAYLYLRPQYSEAVDEISLQQNEVLAEQDILVTTLAIAKPIEFPFVQRMFDHARTSASAIYVLDVESRRPVFEYQAHTRLPIASLTKLVTALVAVSDYELDQTMTVPATVRDVIGSSMGLYAHESMTTEALLYGLLLPSGNDAAHTLATNHPRAYEGFVERMNQSVRELGLNNSHFSNPVGYDENNYASAHDMAMITLENLKEPIINEIIATEKTTLWSSDSKYSHPITTTNPFRHDTSITGIKTGTSESAGQNLILIKQFQTKPVLFVLIGSEDRVSDMEQLFYWFESSVTY